MNLSNSVLWLLFFFCKGNLKKGHMYIPSRWIYFIVIIIAQGKYDYVLIFQSSEYPSLCQPLFFFFNNAIAAVEVLCRPEDVVGREFSNPPEQKEVTLWRDTINVDLVSPEQLVYKTQSFARPRLFRNSIKAFIKIANCTIRMPMCSLNLTYGL